jgi:replicative DNA helicase
VFAGAFVGVLKEDDIKRALLAAGEMERWDQVRPDTEALEKLDEAERIILDLVRRTPPSHAHTEFADLLSRFAAVKREIRAQEPTK